MFAEVAPEPDGDSTHSIRRQLREELGGGRHRDSEQVADDLIRRSATDARFELPSQLGPCRIGRMLGRGGMGLVHEATHLATGATVAIKIVDSSDPSFLGPLETEVEVLAKLTSPHIPRIIDRGTTGRLAWIVIERITGKDLAAKIAESKNAGADDEWVAVSSEGGNPDAEGPRDGSDRRPIPTKRMKSSGGDDVRKAIRWMRDIAAALDDLHAHGICHRDVKPANIVIDDHDRAVLIDYGLSLGPEGDALGELAGTARYMSPEQASSLAVRPPSDIYSLAVTFHEVLTGKAVIREFGKRKILSEIVFGVIPAPSRICESVPRSLDTIFRAALAKNARDRYPSGRELKRDLECWLDDRPLEFARDRISTAVWRRIESNRALFTLATCAILAVAGGLGLTAWRDRSAIGNEIRQVEDLIGRPSDALSGLELALALREAHPDDPDVVATHEHAVEKASGDLLHRYLCRSGWLGSSRRRGNPQVEAARHHLAFARSAELSTIVAMESLYTDPEECLRFLADRGDELEESTFLAEIEIMARFEAKKPISKEELQALDRKATRDYDTGAARASRRIRMALRVEPEGEMRDSTLSILKDSERALEESNDRVGGNRFALGQLVSLQLQMGQHAEARKTIERISGLAADDVDQPKIDGLFRAAVGIEVEAGCVKAGEAFDPSSIDIALAKLDEAAEVDPILVADFVRAVRPPVPETAMLWNAVWVQWFTQWDQEELIPEAVEHAARTVAALSRTSAGNEANLLALPLSRALENRLGNRELPGWGAHFLRISRDFHVYGCLAEAEAIRAAESATLDSESTRAKLWRDRTEVERIRELQKRGGGEVGFEVDAGYSRLLRLFGDVGIDREGAQRCELDVLDSLLSESRVEPFLKTVKRYAPLPEEYEKAVEYVDEFKARQLSLRALVVPH